MKKMKLALMVSALLFPLLTGCTLLDGGGNNNSNNDNDNKENTPPDGDPGNSSFSYKISDPVYDFVQRQSKEEVTYEDLFNLNNKVEITIDVDLSEMQKIQDDNVYGGDYDSIKPETYHLAKSFYLKLTNGSKVFEWTLENVGIRQKGNTSRKQIIQNGEIYNKNHFKISFDETFSDKEMYDADFIAAHKNKEYKDRELLGLSGLDIKWNKVADSTHIKEIYSNMMLRNAGIAAQKVGLGMMKMTYDGGKTADFGLCTIHEQTSKSFIKRSMGSSNSYINMPTWSEENAGTHGVEGKKYGDLYKASYGKGTGASSGPDFTTSSISGKRLGVKTDIKGYNWPTYERKTNTSDEYNDQQMKDLVALLNSSSATYEQITEKVDTEWLAMEEAVMYFLGNPDSMKYNYNNYQVYFRRTDGKAIILPIDNDRCFGVGNGWRSGADYILTSNCKPFTSKALNNNDQRNPLLTKTIFASKDNQSKTNYKACLELVKKSKWVKTETFENYFNIAKQTYSGLADFSLKGGKENVSFSDYMQAKLAIYNGTYDGNAPTPDSGTSTEGLFPNGVALYVVGSFNDWGRDDQYFENFFLRYDLINNEYRICTFKVTKDQVYFPEGEVHLKITNDPNTWEYAYGTIDNSHVIRQTNDQLANDIVFNANIGDLIQISVNAKSGEYFITNFSANGGKEANAFNWWAAAPSMICTFAQNVEATYNFQTSSPDSGLFTCSISLDSQYVDQELEVKFYLMDNSSYYWFGADSEGNITFAGAYGVPTGYGTFIKAAGNGTINVTINFIQDGRVVIEQL